MITFKRNNWIIAFAREDDYNNSLDRGTIYRENIHSRAILAQPIVLLVDKPPDVHGFQGILLSGQGIGI